MSINKIAMGVGIAAGGVILAGAILYAGKDVKFLNYAHQGFDYTG